MSFPYFARDVLEGKCEIQADCDDSMTSRPDFANLDCTILVLYVEVEVKNLKFTPTKYILLSLQLTIILNFSTWRLYYFT